MSNMSNGNPDGTAIVALRKSPEKWMIFVREQAAHLETCGERPDGGYMFGYYQHPEVQPMYGRGGDDEFQEARDAWNDAVDSELRKTSLQRLTEEVWADKGA